MTRTCRGGGKLCPRGPSSSKERKGWPLGFLGWLRTLQIIQPNQPGAQADNDRPIPILSLLLSLKNLGKKRRGTKGAEFI